MKMKTYNKCEFIHYLKFTNILILYLKKKLYQGEKKFLICLSNLKYNNIKIDLTAEIN